MADAPFRDLAKLQEQGFYASEEKIFPPLDAEIKRRAFESNPKKYEANDGGYPI